MGVIIAFILGGVIGIAGMWLLEADRINDMLNIVKMLNEYFNTEMKWAEEEHKSDDYKAGLRKVITLYRYYFKEELQ